VGFSTAKFSDAGPIPLPDETNSGDTPASRALVAHVALERALNGAPRANVLKLARSALAEGDLLRDEGSDGLSWYFAATALAIAEDLEGADVALATAMDHARAHGSAFGFATACFFRSRAALAAGRIDDAAADAQKAVAAQRYGWRMGVAGARAVLANVFLERGEIGNARRELERGAEAAVTSSETPLPFLVGTQARLSLERGEASDALAQYLECGERLMAVDITNPACLPWRSGAALACARLGDLSEAQRLAEEELRLAREFGAPGAIGRALYAQGRILERGGIEVLREAADAFADSQRTLDQAVNFVALGTALRRTGKRRDARQPLREGLDLAERCGASALAEQARAEAVAAGARPRRTALHGSEALTPRERHVASLAAQGMSNREIASTLFVTIKTVEWHLAHGFEKLGISSRKDLRPEQLGHTEKM
jgi:ATP/maltotriose-dependent transcriptional regulator MalT